MCTEVAIQRENKSGPDCSNCVWHLALAAVVSFAIMLFSHSRHKTGLYCLLNKIVSFFLLSSTFQVSSHNIIISQVQINKVDNTSMQKKSEKCRPNSHRASKDICFVSRRRFLYWIFIGFFFRGKAQQQTQHVT